MKVKAKPNETWLMKLYILETSIPKIFSQLLI